MSEFTRADAVALIREKGLDYRPEGFKIVSGYSNWYIDVKYALRGGRDLMHVGELAVHTVQEELGTPFNVVGGPTMGADCISVAVSHAASKAEPPFDCEYFSVRKEIDEERELHRMAQDGIGLPRMPRFPPGTPEEYFWLESWPPFPTEDRPLPLEFYQSATLWVEDAISTGASVRKGMQRYYDHPVARDVPIVAALAVVDRGTAATEMFAELGIPYAALVTYEDLGIPPIGQEY
ncbi:MAG TPA: hypothetical protein VJP80_06390 [Candidatus Saccharimonadales bacterium]|nr:hypothetical protein [Candidatus Saccharimonadales bacterium]